jgi:hypothetical protein
MLAATESIRIRNAEDGENDGIHTIDQVYSNALDLTTGTSLVAMQMMRRWKSFGTRSILRIL